MPATDVKRNVLPKEVAPSEYWLHITPNFTDFSFAGCVKIKLHASAEVSVIKVNYNELTFSKVTLVRGESEEVIDAAKVQYSEVDMTATIPLASPLSGDAFLHIDYAGCMNDKMAGFYRSKYPGPDGKDIYLGTTQFESVDARRAFPCWDEPAHKAVFHITITAPSHMVCISNMPVVSSEAAAGETTTYTYAPTPKMSTYLVAWVIGELDVIQKTVKLPYTPEQETLVSIYTPKGRSSRAHFAMDVTLRVLPLYENFFDRGYNLPKLDLVAVPDFAAGAMENWGLITYRESALLCDAESSVAERQRVAIVVAHELAHQWFGNLVTMEWWKELWLNEAFATYMEYWATDKLFPEWDVVTEFVQSDGGAALRLDAMRSSHPIEVDVSNAQEIDQIFDAISYSKGGSVVRMAIEYIGEEAFQKGISAYIKHFAFSNAATVDLWKFLGEGAGKNITPIMERWTGQQGYPYLTVSKAASDGAAADEVTLTITQNRFLAAGDATEEENEAMWKIPLLISTPESGEQPLLVEGRTMTTTVKASSWIKVNSRQAAFCRVKYDDALLAALQEAIKVGALNSIDRLSIVNDYFAFAKGGFVPTVQVMELLKTFRESEENYSVWSAIVEVERSVRRIVAGTQGEEAAAKFNAYSRELYGDAFRRVGLVPVAGESERTAQLRALLFARMVASKDEGALAAAESLYAQRATAAIPADLRDSVYVAHVRKVGVSAVEEMKKIASETADSVERMRCFSAIGAGCPESISVKDLFAYAFSEHVRPQDSIYVLRGAANDAKVVPEYAKQLMAFWKTIIAKLPGMMVGYASKFIEAGADEAVADELQAFFDTVSEADRMAVGRSFQQGLEGLRSNAGWAKRDAASVAASL